MNNLCVGLDLGNWLCWLMLFVKHRDTKALSSKDLT
jgi:hypothetical protein